MPGGKKSNRKEDRVAKVEKKVRDLQFVADAVEVKQDIGYSPATAVPPQGFFFSLDSITQGIAQNERIADEIKVIEDTFQWEFVNPSTAFDMYARVILFRFDAIESQIATLASSDFVFPADPRGLLRFDAPGNVYSLQYSHKNRLLRIPGAIQVIHDTGPMHLDPTVRTTATKYWNIGRWRSKRPRHVTYTDGVMNDVSKGGLYAMCFTNDPAGTGNFYHSSMFIDP